jgi:hypothetical protein
MEPNEMGLVGAGHLYFTEFSPHNDAGQGLGDDSVEFKDNIETCVPACLFDVMMKVYLFSVHVA